MAKRPRYDEGLRRREGGGAFFVPDTASDRERAHVQPDAPGAAAPVPAAPADSPSLAPATPATPPPSSVAAPTAPTTPRPSSERSAAVPFVRAADLPPLTPRRADGRAGRTVNVKPVLIVLVDDAYRRAAATARANVDKSAFYEALWIVGLRYYDEVLSALAQDPAGERLVEAYAAEAARDDG
ncbi:MAG: hypothetical protein FJX78_10535 [Armatimonadetes bacterium]|nr:hypothetical protein [Armatimonadota bacterium]